MRIFSSSSSSSITRRWFAGVVLSALSTVALAQAAKPHVVVLATGGYRSGVMLASTETYDPARGVWEPAAAMPMARWAHTATVLASGQMLIAGGGTSNNSNATLLYGRSNDVPGGRRPDARGGAGAGL